MADLQALLRRAYPFRNAAPEDLLAVGRLAESLQFDVGHSVYKAGVAPDAFYIIESGTVELIPEGRTVPFAVFSAGHLFGELGFYDSQPRPVNAIARSQAVIHRFPYAGLRELLMERESFAVTFYREGCRFLAGHLTNLAGHVEQRYI